MNRAASVPNGYILYKGEWCHPSRVPRDKRLVSQCLNDDDAKPELVLDNGTKVFTPTQPKRIRQSAKPLMNKLEGRFYDTFGDAKRLVIPQAVTFRLANGVRFTPDFFSFRWIFNAGGEARPTAWEVKGPWFTDDAKVKIKLFAAAYPDVLVLLASEDKPTGMWTMQIVFP